MTQKKIKVCGVVFRKAGKIYYFDPQNLNLSPGQLVVADTSRGHEIGKVAYGLLEIEETEINSPLKKIIRIAAEDDLDRFYNLKIKSCEAFKVGLEKIKKHNLPMKLINVEYTLDNAKIIFYFSAEGRVDFRELVKDLAAVLKKRIELHQIGARDETKILGGLGPCGRPICCSLFLTNFETVSISMAKEQNLSLNPSKISGKCERLMCCLRYENDAYIEIRSKMPPIGSQIVFEETIGEVIEYNIPKQTIIVKLPSQAKIEVTKEQIRPATKEDKEKLAYQSEDQ